LPNKRFRDAQSNGEGVMSRVANYNFPKIKFCRQGHAILGDNIKINWKGGVVRCRRCATEAHKRMRQRGTLRPATIARIKEEVHNGATLSVLSGASKSSKGCTIHVKRLRLWCEANPKEGRPLWKLILKNGQAAIERNRVKNIVASPSIIRAADDIMDLIEAAVPRHLQKDHRDDVIQNIWLDVLQRKFSHHEIAARASGYVRAEYKANHNAWGDRSLDVPIYLDSNTTLLDTLTRGLWN
jgi:hypothetical protein